MLVKVYLHVIRTSCGKEFETDWVEKEVIRSVETSGMQTAQISCGKEFERETRNFPLFLLERVVYDEEAAEKLRLRGSEA